MYAAKNKEPTIKYTTVLPSACIDELKELSDKNIIPSVSQGIRLAVEGFVVMQKQVEYNRMMNDASNDAEFIQRTMDTQSDFSIVDSEGDEPW